MPRLREETDSEFRARIKAAIAAAGGDPGSAPFTRKIITIPDANPAPWHWEPGRIGHSGTYPDGHLVDAAGRVIVDRDDGDSRPPPPLDGYTRATMAAAATLREKLRDALAEMETLARALPPGSKEGADAVPLMESISELLVGIEKAGT